MRKAAGGFSPLIPIDRTSGRPLHRQVYDAFRSMIVGRSLRPGQQIPSTRALAAELGMSRIPVLNAYAQLLAEGYFESRAGAGTYVSSSLPHQTIRPDGGAKFAAQINSGPRRVGRTFLMLPPYKTPPENGRNGAFNVSEPAYDAFPFKVWANLVARHGRNSLASSHQYGNPMGLQQLREAVAIYLRTSRGVRCEPHQIMIVSGSQQALYLSARVLVDAGSAVWMEEPGYRLARNVLNAVGCRIVPVPVDTEGLDVTAGVKRCRTARAAFVAPSHQYPLGVTMSASRRLQLLDWARKAGSWIIEDDYDSEYRYGSKPIASLQGLDYTSRVIYIGTFSKVLFPALRVGYIVIPPDLLDHFLTMRQVMDVSPPQLSQAVLADFIGEGHFSRHVRRMRILYGERRATLVDSLQREFGSFLQVIGDKAGMHLAVTLPKGLDDREISIRAAREKLWLWPLSPLYIGKASHQGFILGFGSTTAAEMPNAVNRLFTILNTPKNRISAAASGRATSFRAPPLRGA